MNTDKLSDFFAVNIQSMKYFGLWYNVKYFRQSPKLITAYILVVNLFCIYLSQICHFVYMYKARSNVMAFADEFYVSLTTLMVVFKNFSMLRNSDRIHKILEEVDAKIFKPRNSVQMKMIRNVRLLVIFENSVV